jgi:hypothetical protein
MSKARHTLGTLWKAGSGLRWAVALLAVLAISAWLPGTASAVKGGGGGISLNTSLPHAERGVAYSYQLVASGGTAPYTFAITGGALPVDYSMTSAGLITGQSCANANGTYKFDVRVTDAASASQTFSNVSLEMNRAPGGQCDLTVTLSGLPATGTVGAAYSGTVTASGGTSPFTYSITSGSLPAGLSLSAAGAVSGTPTTAGASNFTVQATDAGGNTGIANYTITVSSASITVNPSSLSGGTVGTAYSATISATGGSGSYTSFAVTSGSLPAGLSLNSGTGAISGTPTAGGSSNFTIRVTDSASNTGSRPYTMSISWTSITVNPTSLSSGTVGSAYSTTISAAGGSGSYTTFAVTSGSLPGGLALNASTGALSGTPTAGGGFNFTITVTDSASNTGNRPYSLSIAWSPIVVDPSHLPDGTSGTPYSETISATGGTGSYSSFAVTWGSLPDGLSLNPTSGVLSGTPTAKQTRNFRITATDSGSNTGGREYTVQIKWAAITVSPAGLVGGSVNSPYSATISATGGSGSYTNFSVTSGALPAGLSLNASSGALSGTPTTAGSSTFAITVTDSDAGTGSKSYTLVIAPAGAIVLGPASLPKGTTNVAYSQTVTATGCVSSCTFSVGSGLPLGLSLNATTGVLSGTPTAAGTYNFTITAAEGTNNSNKDFTIVIYDPIVISPASLSNGTMGAAYSATFGATGGSGTYSSFAVTTGGLPAGLSLNSGTGVLSGTPSAAGDSTFTITVTDSASNTASKQYTVSIAWPAIVVAPVKLPSGTVGGAYSVTMGATGGNGNYASFVVTAGSLPPGLSLSAATHALSGTPTSAGRWTLTVTVTDSVNGKGARGYTLDVAEGRVVVEVESSSANSGSSGTPYSGQVVASGGLSPYRYAIVSGSLPPGLALDGSTGAISGIPTRSGRFTFTVRTVDAADEEAFAVAAITIQGGSILTVAPDVLPNSLQGVSYAANVTASGGAAPYIFAIVSGALPAGLTLDPVTGAISGMSTTAGTFHFTVKATDANGDFGTHDYAVQVASRPDPSKDAEVKGLVNSQMQASLRFAGAQIDNVMQHLVGLRESFGCGVRPDVALSVSPTRPASEGASDPAAATLASNALNQAVGQALQGDCGDAKHRTGVWTSGSIDYDSAHGKLSATGLTAGIETQFSRSLVVGAAFGVGFDRDSIGTNGTKSNSNALNFMAYGSYRFGKRVFVEAMGGYGRLNSDNTRFVTSDGSLLNSQRPGHALFTSVSIGTQVRAHGFSASPYLRNDLISASLDAYQEGGVTPFALGFARARQTVDVLVAGSRLTYTVRMPWGRISPLARVEYRHRFASSFTQAMFYADHPELPYELPVTGERHDSASAAAGAEVAVWGLIFDLEYSAAGASLDNFSDHALRGSVRLGF